MAKKSPSEQVSWIWVDYRTDVPNWLAAGIGHIAVEWSHLESQFEEAIRLLLPGEMHIGRIIATGMNMRSRVMTTTNLVYSYVYYGKLKQALHDEIAKIGNKITDGVETERNKLVHGLWGRVEGHWELLRNSGARALPPVGKLPRAVMPQREQITPEKIKSIRDKIKSLSAQMDAFCAKLEVALPPSPYKSRREVRQSHPSRARRKKAPSDQPQSSHE